MNRERITHKLTAYHWRYDRNANGSSLMLCSCGWACRFVRDHRRNTRWRSLRKLCWFRGHQWSGEHAVHTGPVDFKESEDTFVDSYRQCERCFYCDWP